MGQETRYNSSSSSNSEAYVIFPVGSGRAATSSIPWSVDSHLSPLNKSSRFTNEADRRPATTSFCAAYLWWNPRFSKE